MNTGNLSNKVRKGLFWSLISSWGNKLLTLVLFMVLARVLDQHDLGVFAAALVVFNFLTLFVDQGLCEAIVQKAEVNERQLNAIFVINLVLAILIFGLLWVGAPLLAAYMKMPELTDILRVGSVSILIGALCFSQQAMHRRHFNYRWIAICLFASTVMGGIAAIYCAMQGYGPWALVVQTLVAAVVTAIMLWVKPQWRLSLDFHFKGVRSMLRYGLTRLGTNVLDFAYSRYIEIFLAAVLGPVALGIYSVGVRVYQALMQALSGAILDVAHNGFSRLAHDREALLAAYYRSMMVTAAVAVPVFLMLAALAPEATHLLFGGKWAASADVMSAMALLGAVQVLQFYNGTVLNAIGRPSMSLAIAVFKTVLTLTVLFSVRTQGMMVIIYAYVASQLASTPISFFMARMVVGISLKAVVANIWPFVLASIVMVGMITALREFSATQSMPAFAKLLILGGAGGSCYAALVLLTARQRVLIVLAFVKARRLSGD